MFLTVRPIAFSVLPTLAASTFFTIALMYSPLLLAEHGHITEILVSESSDDNHNRLIAAHANTMAVDAGDIVKSLPGANVNGNGAITNILQYRGMYGDRVAISLDNSPPPSGGPNGMDSPLSYMSPLLLKSVAMTRGLANVSEASESLGGSLRAEFNRGSFTKEKPTSSLAVSGQAASYTASNDRGNHSALRTTLSNQTHKINVLAAIDKGDDREGANNTAITGSQYNRRRYDVSYAIQTATSNALVYAGHVDTGLSGTPALAMDIRKINSNLYGFQANKSLGEYLISGYISSNTVNHHMNNFSLRDSNIAPISPMAQRLTVADSDALNWRLSIKSENMLMGIDGQSSEHNARIHNPSNAAFLINNFNDTKRSVYGIFAEWQGSTNSFQHNVGVRYNRAALNSGKVSASGLPPMMAMAANPLASQFNESNRHDRFDHVDAVLKSNYQLNKSTEITIGIAHKNRAPSYQQRYLWLPLSATGGLADGRNYIGNSELDSEMANEITVGIHHESSAWLFSPELFYRRVDDYIQGVPTSNMLANNLSQMMTGKPALMFDNIDAQLAGADLLWGYTFNEHWQLLGTLSYVRGKRTDQTDNLYRIAPLTSRISVVWQHQRTRLELESSLQKAQHQVSAFNDERTSSGYGLVNIKSRYTLNDSLHLRLTINNLFDQVAANHLGGYNRNPTSDIAIGERLLHSGRAVLAGVTWSFH